MVNWPNCNSVDYSTWELKHKLRLLGCTRNNRCNVFSKYLRFHLRFVSERPNGNSMTKQLANYHSSDLDKVSQMAEWHLAIRPTFLKRSNGNSATVLMPNCRSVWQVNFDTVADAVAEWGGGHGGHDSPPHPYKISHRRVGPHIFHVSCFLNASLSHLQPQPPTHTHTKPLDPLIWRSLWPILSCVQTML